MPSPISGYHSPGPRFRILLRPISHKTLYLPTQMRKLPQIIQLIQGVSPLTVFNCDNIKAARQAFYALRKKFDFTYWCVLEYKVKDFQTRNFIPFRLNSFQHNLANSLLKHSYDSNPKKFIISKTIPNCGQTTCVQAFILWRQLYHMDNSITFVPNPQDIEELKSNFTRTLNVQAGYDTVYMNDDGNIASFRDFRYRNVYDETHCRFVHLADMSKWYDPTTDDTKQILTTSLKNWIQKEGALFILEGDYPKDPRFRMQDYRNYNTAEFITYLQLTSFNSNPVYLFELIKATDPTRLHAFTPIQC